LLQKQYKKSLRSPSARAGNAMAIYFFTGNKVRFLFFGHKKKSVISLQIFIINFSLRTVGPD
jgi:hypothetical protein